MSRKHFEAVAAALRTELYLEGGSHHGREIITGVALRLADTFAEANPRFDRARFMAAVIGPPATRP